MSEKGDDVVPHTNCRRCFGRLTSICMNICLRCKKNQRYSAVDHPDLLRIAKLEPQTLNMCVPCKFKTERLILNPPKPKEPKIKIFKPRPRDMSSCVCKVCKQDKPRLYEKLDGRARSTYRDDHGLKWKGRVCPACTRAKDRRRHKQPQEERSCIICSTIFSTPVKTNRLCCSEGCSRRNFLNKSNELKKTKRLLNPKPPRPKKEKWIKPKSCKVHFKNCTTCQKFYTARTAQSLYCRKQCSPTYKDWKRRSRKKEKITRRGKFRMAISKFYTQELIDLYKNRGTFEVDHIIPLNHPDVCGLHVPWNLTYLDKETNGLKSNLWDGTMENKNWRELCKPAKSAS